MNKDELIARLGKYEWKDVEFKKAQRGVPIDTYETVAAFSNTAGGYLVFGVKDTNGILEIVGVIEVDSVQNDFLSCLRSGGKLNRVITANEDAFEHEGKTLLVFYIPEAQRSDKPVYINADIRKSYIRRGAGDEQCTQTEIERFLRDASGITYDCEILRGCDVEDCFDKSTVDWYRRLFQQNQDTRHAELNNVEFLNEWGFVIEAGDSLVPTRAAILLFGKDRYVRQILPRGVIDFQRIDAPFDDWSPDMRWHDRVVVEENIIKAWQILVEKYMRIAERPFSIDTATLRRHDDPPDYISFREAAINLLIHQDYGDHSRKPVIKIFSDRTIFWNPGDAFVTVDQLLDPTEKEVRNPSIVGAFRRIGLSDQAGTGMRSIFHNWRQQGFIPPIIDNDKTEKTFQLVMLKESLLTERQLLFQAQLGVNLSNQEAEVFAFACRSDLISITDVKALTGLRNRDSRAILDRLVTNALLKVVDEGLVWDVVDHLKDRYLQNDDITDQPPHEDANLITDQPDSPEGNLVTPLLTNLNDTQREIIKLCEIPRKQADIMQKIGVSHRTHFSRRHLEPLIHAHLVSMTHPDEPNHPDQAYVITNAGLDLLRSWNIGDSNGDNE